MREACSLSAPSVSEKVHSCDLGEGPTFSSLEQFSWNPASPLARGCSDRGLMTQTLNKGQEVSADSKEDVTSAQLLTQGS